MISIIMVSPFERNVQVNERKPILTNKLYTCWSAIEKRCKDGGISSLKYFGDRNRHWLERLWWFCLVIVSIFVCCYFMVEINRRRSSHPVSVVFDDKISTIDSIPFPAVTVCPATKIAASQLNITAFSRKYSANWPKSFENATHDEVTKLKAAFQICRSEFLKKFELPEFEWENGKNVVEHLSDVALEREDIFRACNFSGQPFDCKEFKKVIGEKGPCFSFNMLNSRDIFTENVAPELLTVTDNPDINGWNMPEQLQNLFLHDDDQPSLPNYPIHVKTLYDMNSLDLELYFNADDWIANYECEAPLTKSFKIFLHRPDEPKDGSTRFYEIEAGRKVLIFIEPHIIAIQKYLDKYNAKQRECYFSEEHPLKYFKVYTKNNCDIECLSNFTKALCGCVKFSMPRDSETKVCTGSEFTCFYHAQKKYRQMHHDSFASDFRDNCDCLPSCSFIKYLAEANHLKYIHEKGNLRSEAITTILISFKSIGFVPLRRSEKYDTLYMISAYGGLLGLFLGISLLSLLEIIFYCTIPIVYRLFRRAKKPFQPKSLLAMQKKWKCVQILPPLN